MKPAKTRSQLVRNNIARGNRGREAMLAGGALAALSYLLCHGSPYRPVQPLPDNIIDLHCHIAGIGAGDSGCFVCAKLRRSWRFAIYLKSFGVSERELLGRGDALVADRLSESLARSQFVKKAVVLAMDGVVGGDGLLDTNRTEVYVPNEFVEKMVGTHTNLLFGASVNPYRKDALERLSWAKAHQAVLIKWLPSIMEIDPSDPRLIPFYQKLVELDLPLLTHAGKERSFSSAKDALCDPDKLRLPLSLGVKVIAAHIASTGTFEGERSTDRLLRMMREYPNLYSDISSLTQVNKLGFMKEALSRPELEGRLFYGTDYPLINTALVSPWYYLGRLNLREILEISRAKNPWDRDVRLKQSLGLSGEVFGRAASLIEAPVGDLAE